MSTQHNGFKAVETALKALPVNDVVNDVVNEVKAGKATILTAQTGSGKTLLASTKLADASEDQVLVLVPRRFLAVNAAETVAKIRAEQEYKDRGQTPPDGANLESLGLEDVGKDVGYAIGRQVDSRANFTPKTKLVFATYGYALSSGMINTAKTVVCDEVHEAGIDTSLARAVLHKRLKTDPSLKLLEMSATLDAPKQAKFWEDVKDTKIFHAAGNAHPCEQYHDPDNQVIHAVRDLLNKGKKGVAVFRAGIGDVEKTKEDLEVLLRDSGINDVEIAIIHGESKEAERIEAQKPPAPGKRKVIIGTNVIESGVNLMWLDSGVSDGFTKIPYYRENGAKALMKEPLPSWRIIQQKGRVIRSGPGEFVLCNKKGYEDRPQENIPEISRVSLNELVMYAAGLNLDPTQLKYDAPIADKGFDRAKEELGRMGLITDDWKLTEKGQFVHDLPLGVEAATMLYKAPPEIMGDAIMLAAVSDIGSLRADYMQGHGLSKQSDVLDGFKAIKELGPDADEEQCLKKNVGFKQYEDVWQKIKELHERMGTSLDMNFRKAESSELVQLMMQGGVNHLFEMRNKELKNLATNAAGFAKDKNSVLSDKNDDRFAIAQLRAFQTFDGTEKTIAHQVSRIGRGDLCQYAATHPEMLQDLHFDRNEKGRDRIVAKYFGGTEITMSIPKQPDKQMKMLLNSAHYDAYKQKADATHPHTKPQGRDNTDAWDEQKAKAEKRKTEEGKGRGGRKERKMNRKGRKGKSDAGDEQ